MRWRPRRAISPFPQTAERSSSDRGRQGFQGLGRCSRAPTAQALAPQEKFDLPSGPCFAPDGTLFLAEFDRVLKFERTAKGWEKRAPIAIVPEGALVPPEVTGHGQACAFAGSAPITALCRHRPAA